MAITQCPVQAYASAVPQRWRATLSDFMADGRARRLAPGNPITSGLAAGDAGNPGRLATSAVLGLRRR